MIDMSQFSSFFEEGLAIGVIVVLFAILFFLLKKMMEQNEKYHTELESKDVQLIDTIKEFNSTILKINDAHDRNLQNIVDTSTRIESKVDKIIEKINE